MTICNFSFTFLGTGTSAGIPVIACDCNVCTSTDTKNKRLRCSVCIQFTDDSGQDRVILIDTSPDLRQQVLREKLQRCDAILFTHNHVDHTFGLDEVRLFNVSMKQSIDVYAEQQTLGHLQRVFKHVFEPHTNANDSFVADLITHEVIEGVPLSLFGVEFTPIRLMHGNLPIVGFIIEAEELWESSSECQTPSARHLKIAYCTDVSSIPAESLPLLTGLDILVLDMLRLRPHPTHLHLDQAVETARQIDAKQTWFTHMTHCIEHQEVDARLPDRINLAYDCLRI